MSGLSYAQILARGNGGSGSGESSGATAEEAADQRASSTLPRNYGKANRGSGGANYGPGALPTDNAEGNLGRNIHFVDNSE